MKKWPGMLLAILIGNLVYLVARPYLPDLLVHQRFQFDAGLILDFGICLALYAVVRRFG